MAPDEELILPDSWPEMIKLARHTRANAFASFSGYRVGAAVLTNSGNIYSGCNVENSSYGLTICAERSAVCAAVSAGETDLTAIVISLTGVAVPCGACRQFLYEFNPQMTVILDDLTMEPDHIPEGVPLNELLPRGFRLDR